MQQNEKNSIVIVGDTFPNNKNLKHFCSGNIDSLFGEKICDVFAKADLTICNLEGALSDNPDRCSKAGPVLVAPTKAVTAYKNLGIDYCALANNHITDGGHQGVIDTMDTLTHAEIQYIGAGCNENEITHFCFCRLGGMNVCIYNVSETFFNRPSVQRGGAWLYDEYLVCREISELKQKCDYLIVIYHGGIEYFRFPSPEIKKRFHRMADNGANMILSQHTHCIGCEEWYNGAYLLYGQGNFLFRDYSVGVTDEGLILEIVFTKGKIEIKKHLVKCIDKTFVRYDDSQDLTAFEHRSMLLNDEEYVKKEFQRFCNRKITRYLAACRNKSLFLKGCRKLFPSLVEWYLIKTFRLKNLLSILCVLYSEQLREQHKVGMEVLLGDKL